MTSRSLTAESDEPCRVAAYLPSSRVVPARTCSAEDTVPDMDSMSGRRMEAAGTEPEGSFE